MGASTQASPQIKRSVSFCIRTLKSLPLIESVWTQAFHQNMSLT